MSGELVAVTGAAGFTASYVIARLLRRGHLVRAVVRSWGEEWQVREQVATAGWATGPSLTFAVQDGPTVGWAAAVAGCAGVVHLTGPDSHPPVDPVTTTRLLAAADAADVGRVVLVGDGDGAHRAGELVVLVPGTVLGPVLSPRHPASIDLVDDLLHRVVPGTVRLWFTLVDVRDLAAATVDALSAPDAAGRRLAVVAGDPISQREIAWLLTDELGDAAQKVPTHDLPDPVVRFAGRFNRRLRAAVPRLGVITAVSTAEAEEVLGWSPRPVETTVLDTARSLIAHEPKDTGGSILGVVPGLAPGSFGRL